LYLSNLLKLIFFMLSTKIQAALNKQIRLEGESSQDYLAMAVWCETQGYEGMATFMYAHADEERMHMLKLIKYINERGGVAEITTLKAPANSFNSPVEMFKIVLKHEIFVSTSINTIVGLTFEEKDFATHNFLQWYVAEQIEEEALFRTVLDKINLIDDSKNGLYLFDKDIKTLLTDIV